MYIIENLEKIYIIYVSLCNFVLFVAIIRARRELSYHTITAYIPAHIQTFQRALQVR